MRQDLAKFQDPKLIAARTEAALKFIMPRIEPYLTARNDIAAEAKAISEKIALHRANQAAALTEMGNLRRARRALEGQRLAQMNKKVRDLQAQVEDLGLLIADLEVGRENLRAQAQEAHAELFKVWHQVQAEFGTTVQEQLDCLLLTASIFMAAHHEGMNQACQQVMCTPEYPEFGPRQVATPWQVYSPLRVRKSMSVFRLIEGFEPAVGSAALLPGD